MSIHNTIPTINPSRVDQNRIPSQQESLADRAVAFIAGEFRFH